MTRSKLWLVSLALVALTAGAAQGEMWAGGYLGGSWGASDSSMLTFTPTGLPRYYSASVKTNYTGDLQGAFQGGLKIGAWFEKSGVLAGINFPTWMKYFGFYTDFSYHRLNFRHNQGQFNVRVRYEGNNNGGDDVGPFQSSSYSFVAPFGMYTEGYAATWAFMFAGRYGFFPDADVPFGRLQLMLAVGPAILFSGQTPTITALQSVSGFGPYAQLKFNSQSSTDICLAVETGLRFMALKNVSIDATFKYRYAAPSYSYSLKRFAYVVTANNNNINYLAGADLKLDPTYHLFSFQIGANYHF
uniref:Outer membrane protein beta-barrel domain-containing protein n=1 Tax=Desulfobacca acetoxidans TaxID=60893 RepID=A0A7V4GAD2_9BACT